VCCTGSGALPHLTPVPHLTLSCASLAGGGAAQHQTPHHILPQASAYGLLLPCCLTVAQATVDGWCGRSCCSVGRQRCLRRVAVVLFPLAFPFLHTGRRGGERRAVLRCFCCSYFSATLPHAGESISCSHPAAAAQPSLGVNGMLRRCSLGIVGR